jgi:hypothetical protein
MRRITIGIIGASAIAAAGCGGGSKFANRPRPPSPINLTVYINNARVSVSPSSVGAGPIVFIVTNQASHAESLEIQPANAASGSQPTADTGPINPQATATVKVDLAQGDYTMMTVSGSSSQSATATEPMIQPAQLRIGPPRPSAKNATLQP